MTLHSSDQPATAATTVGHPSGVAPSLSGRMSGIDGTNPNLPSRLRSGRYRVKTRPSATRGQHCNSATPRQLTQFARRCGNFTTSGFGPPSTTRAGRPIWSVALGDRRLWLLLNPKAVTIVTNMGRTRNGREGHVAPPGGGSILKH